MINWVIGLFVAAAVAAFLGFGGVASAFGEVARIAFFVLLVLFVITAVITLARSRGHGAHAALRTASLVAVVAALSIGIYAWVENDMSAERAGRVIDRQTVAMADGAREALGAAGDRTGAFMERTVAEVRSDVRDAADPDQTDDSASREQP